MIERLRLKNFQKHGDFRTELDPRVTAIVGPSDSGKSSLLRSYAWLMLNRPRGSSFIRHNQKEAMVELWVDGVGIRRERTKTKNRYRLRKDGKTIDLEAVGSSVPEDVRSIIRMTEDNFQDQHDPPYWFSLSGREVAKRLNEIVDLDQADRAIKWLGSRKNKAKSEVEVCKDRISRAKAEKSVVEFAPKLKRDFDQLRRQQADLVEIGDEIGSLTCLVADMTARKKRAADLTAIVQGSEKDLRRLDERKAMVDGLADKVDGIGHLIQQIESTKKRVSRSESDLNELAERFRREFGKTCPLCGQEVKQWET